MISMKNPIAFVQHTRTTYSKLRQENVVEVLVQFRDEPPAWIPYATLLAIKEQ